MMRRPRFVSCVGAIALTLVGTGARATESSFEYGRFGHVTVYAPDCAPNSSPCHSDIRATAAGTSA
jgi:hypothetical protein